MVCEIALEVAAKRSYEYEGDRKRISYVGWDNEPGEVRAEWRESVRQALLPYLQALSPDHLPGTGNMVPDGWVLVPKDPTTKMLAAGQTAWLADPLRKSSTLYRAMLDAAGGREG